MSLQIKQIYEFGPFRLDAAEHLLLRERESVPLTPKAFDLLLALVERHGHLLEKEELLKKVWPDTFVEETNLASNISQLRKALGDGENGHRYIETAPKRGYRFVANVKKVEDERAELTIREQAGSQSAAAEGEQAANADAQIPAHPAVVKAEGLAGKVKRYQRSSLIALAALILLGLGLAFFVLRAPLQPKVAGYTPITSDGHQKAFPRFGYGTDIPLVAGDSHLYFTEPGGISQVSSLGGETVAIPTAVPNPFILDLSPGRTEFLLASRTSAPAEWPLWVAPVSGEGPHRLGNIWGHSGTWSPDGRQIVYAYGSELYLVQSDGTEPSKLVSVSDRAFGLRWSPDGSRLRFTIQDSKSFSTSLWELAVKEKDLHPLLPGWNTSASACCGNWTAGGKYFVFQSSRDRKTDIWAMRERAGSQTKSEPVQLTDGPMSFWYPTPSRDGRRIFVAGVQQRGELARYDVKTQRFESFLPNLSAEYLDFSQDGEWITYVTYPEGDLWRSKVDGSQRLRLSFPPLRATLPRWSPDGKKIAFTALTPGKPAKIYVVSAGGGSPQQLTQEDRREQDPGWSPDGKMLVFGGISSRATVYLLDVNTLEVSMLTGSEGNYSPRWSPDGRYIAALSTDGQRMMLFDRTSEKWTVLVTMGVGSPHWSRDGKYIYFAGRTQDGPALYRVRIEDQKVEWLVSLKNLRRVVGVFGAWVGWAPDDSPLVLRDVGSQDIYALEWQAP